MTRALHTRVLLASAVLATLSPRIAPAQGITLADCRDFRGVPVVSIVDTGIADLAAATLMPDGAPVILYNPELMQQLHPKTRAFFHAHECAHHALGHLPLMARSVELTSTLEQVADCAGIRALVASRQVTDQQISLIQRDIAALGQGDWDHLPGPMRAVNLRRCLWGMQPP